MLPEFEYKIIQTSCQTCAFYDAYANNQTYAFSIDRVYKQKPKSIAVYTSFNMALAQCNFLNKQLFEELAKSDNSFVSEKAQNNLAMLKNEDFSDVVKYAKLIPVWNEYPDGYHEISPLVLDTVSHLQNDNSQ